MSEEQGHTAGPWRRDYMGGYGKGGIFCDDPLFEGKPLAAAHFPPDYDRGCLSQRAFDVAAANARLIAAAPDLLEALGDARAAIANLDEYSLGGAEVTDTATGECIGQYGLRDELLAKIDAAISRAKGQSNG